MRQAAPDLFFLFLFPAQKDSSVDPRGGVFGLLPLIIICFRYRAFRLRARAWVVPRPSRGGRPTQALCSRRGARGAWTGGVLL